MLAWGLAVAGLGMRVGPSVSHNLMYQCSYKGDRVTNRLSQVSGRYGPTSHRIFPSACCSPAAYVSVLPLPCACLGPASPACPPRLPTAPVSLWLSLCQHAHTDRTFRKSALESDVPGSEAIEEGFHYLETTVLQVESTCRQQQGCPWPPLPKARDKPPLSLPSALCSGDT